MDEAKLSMSQSRKLSKSMLTDSPLPPPTRASSAVHSSSKNIFGMKRNYYFAKRNIHQIMLKDSLNVPEFVPPKIQSDRTKEKEILQEIMTFGRRGRKKPKPSTKISIKLTKEMRLEELENEIRERVEFLDDMTRLGQRERYENIIKSEIETKLRETDQVRKMTEEDFAKFDVRIHRFRKDADAKMRLVDTKQ